jgi:hypothetical protein
LLNDKPVNFHECPPVNNTYILILKLLLENHNKNIQ